LRKGLHTKKNPPRKRTITEVGEGGYAEGLGKKSVIGLKKNLHSKLPGGYKGGGVKKNRKKVGGGRPIRKGKIVSSHYQGTKCGTP